MKRYRRYLIALCIIAALVGAYAAAGFLAVPYFARRSAQNLVRTHYGRTLGIEAVHFNPFTLAVEVVGLALPDADGQKLLGFERLRLRLQLASLWRLGPSFGEIVLQQPYVRVVLRPGGTLNLADLGQGFAPTPSTEARKSGPLRLYIGRFAVISGTATFEDRTQPTSFQAEFTPIAFELRDFSTIAAAGTGNSYTLSAASPQGERLSWSGTLRLDPLTSHGAFEISDLKAPTLWSYLRERAPFEIDSGVINLKGDYDVANSAGQPSVSLAVHSVAVSALGLKPRGAAHNYIDIGRIEVDDTRLDLKAHAIEVGKVQLSQGDIKAWLSEQGRLNLLDLTAGSSAAAGPAAAPTGAGPVSGPATPAPDKAPAAAGNAAAAPAWTVSVPDITLQGFKISAEDRRTRPAAALELSPLNLHVAGFNTSPDDTLDIALTSGVNGSGRLDARAKLALRSGAVTAHLEATDLALAMAQPYLAQYTSMTLLRGRLGAALDFERQPDGSLALKGSTQVADLRTVDNALRLDFIDWRSLRVADISYRSKPAGLKIGSVTAVEPYVRMIIAPDRSVNIARVLTAPGARASEPAPAAAPAPPAAVPAPPAAQSPPAPPRPSGHARKGRRPAQGSATAAAAPVTSFPVAIGTVRFVNAAANYSDLWIKPSFAVGIQSLSGTVSGLSSDPRSRATLELNGKVDRYSPVHIGGTLNLLSTALYTDVTMSFKDLDLTIVNPYSGHFAGYRIDKGKLSVDVSYHIEQRKLDAKQHFVIDQLELGERVESPDAVHLPLKIAVALLRDRNGLIDLQLPMNGSLDDPTFRIGPIIWKIFVNLIEKAATAPFALLGHLFGGGEHVNVIEFAAGSAALDPAATQQLAALTKALTERPQLKLDVPIVYSTAADRAPLAAARLRAQLEARAQASRAGRQHPDTALETVLAEPAQHFALLVEEFQADLGKDTPLPPSALAVQQAKRKEAPLYEPAIADLNAALIDHIAVGDADLLALGKQRAQAIQDALLSGGQVDPGRVFIVGATPATAAGDKVKVEMAVK